MGFFGQPMRYLSGNFMFFLVSFIVDGLRIHRGWKVWKIATHLCGEL